MHVHMSEVPPIDANSIEQLRAINPDDGGEFLRELIDIFLSDTPRRIDEIASALTAGNGSVLSRAAHSIKGSSGNFGATRLATMAQAIESHGKLSELSQVKSILPDFRNEYERVKAALELLRTGP